MSRLRQAFLWSGCALVLAFAMLLGYAWQGEAEMRNMAHPPGAVDYGFIPVDLLQGRTHYEGRTPGKVVYSLNFGEQAEGRVMMARVACGLGALGAVLLAVRAFLKESR